MLYLDSGSQEHFSFAFQVLKQTKTEAMIFFFFYSLSDLETVILPRDNEPMTEVFSYFILFIKVMLVPIKV